MIVDYQKNTIKTIDYGNTSYYSTKMLNYQCLNTKEIFPAHVTVQ